MSDEVAHPLARKQVQVDADVSAGRLPPVTAAGVTLIKVVLGMVMASILILTVYLWTVDRQEGGALAEATQIMLSRAGAGKDAVQQLADLTKELAGQRAAFRAFWLQVAQLILLNLLLPLLTALLGYIFGASQAARAQAEE